MTKEALGLTVPEQLYNATEETSIAFIKKWLTNLQISDTVIAMQELINKLDTLNATTLEPADRFNILELFQPLIKTNYELLKKRYLGQTQPLPIEKIEVISLSRNIHIAILNGYKIILENIKQNSSFFSSNTMLHHIIYRCFKHFNKILDSYYQSYTEYTENIWKEMHIIYNYAIDNNLTTTVVTIDQNQYPIPINTITPYKQALFLAAASPYEWRQQDQQAIYNVGMLWHEYIIIRKFNNDDLKDKTAKFFITINEDCPIISLYLEHNFDADNGYTLDLTKLIKYVQELPKDYSLTKLLPNSPVLANYSLEKLMHRLEYYNYRKTERFKISGNVFVASGFSATHYHVNQKRTFNPETVGSNSDDNMESLELGNSLLEEINQENDKNFRIDKALYKCKLINIHAEGAGIIFENIIYPPIQPIEIIAMSIVIDDNSNLDQTRWNIGMIKWLKLNKQNQLVAGIEIFAPFAMAAAIQLIKDGNAAGYYQRAFIFNDVTNNKYNLITPTIKVESNQTVSIYSFYHKKFATAKLGKELMNNNNFKCFAIDANFSK